MCALSSGRKIDISQENERSFTGVRAGCLGRHFKGDKRQKLQFIDKVTISLKEMEDLTNADLRRKMQKCDCTRKVASQLHIIE